MRVRIVRRPPIPHVDGVSLDQYEPGLVYEVGSRLGGLMLAEGWAEPATANQPAVGSAEVVEPLVIEMPSASAAGPEPSADAGSPPNLVREGAPFSMPE